MGHLHIHFVRALIKTFSAGRRSLLVHYPVSSTDIFCLASPAPTPAASHSLQSAGQSAAAAPSPNSSYSIVWQVRDFLLAQPVSIVRTAVHNYMSGIPQQSAR